ncbi:MAG: shikimate kinase [Sphingobacteriales bacterium]|jgi:shikimate kinase
MRFYIIGFMGSGKTTLAKKVASLLDLPLIDLDAQIVENAGKSIPEIFSEFGESHFRALERNSLEDTKSIPSAIISCGGGAPCFGDNMDWMNKNGFTIFLNLPVGALADRLKNSKNKRPLLNDLKISLEEYITEKLTEREPFYAKAQLIVPGIGLKPKELAEIIEIIEEG